MKLSKLIIAATVVAAGVGSLSTSAVAQGKEQFFPLLSYRTGPYAPNGTPWANGKQDYIKLINARDGGINGVKLTFEECETGYATDRGVECYERLKGKPGVTFFDPQSTGITFALTEKAPIDKIPLLTVGYGLSMSADGMACNPSANRWAAWTSSKARRLLSCTTTARLAKSRSRCWKSARKCTATTCSFCL